jgi:FkbM family methyltransferase
MSFVYFDVGANWGEKSIPDARINSDWVVYAFEPTPHLAVNLLSQTMQIRDRYNVVQVALSNYNGLSVFHIQNNPGQGCNSLNAFSENSKEIFPHFASDLVCIEKLLVTVSRLDTWFKNNSFPYEKIDYFKCDTQGSDLKVLQGMGDSIQLIRRGEAECSRSRKTALYSEDNLMEEMVEYLKSKGFRVPKIISNDHLDNEYNVHFEEM